VVYPIWMRIRIQMRIQIKPSKSVRIRI
jgi:hypothetical protein